MTHFRRAWATQTRPLTSHRAPEVPKSRPMYTGESAHKVVVVRKVSGASTLADETGTGDSCCAGDDTTEAFLTFCHCSNADCSASPLRPGPFQLTAFLPSKSASPSFCASYRQLCIGIGSFSLQSAPQAVTHTTSAFIRGFDVPCSLSTEASEPSEAARRRAA